jgi:hypothetical protein
MENCTTSESGHHGAIRKRYTCNQCDKEFSKQGDFKRHHKSEHKLREEKKYENTAKKGECHSIIILTGHISFRSLNY